MITYIIILTLLAVLAIAALFRAWQRVKAIEDYTLLARDRAGCSQSLGFIGCSAICYGIEQTQQISELLQQEYERFEVIIVLNAIQESDLLKEIITRFRLIQVNTPTRSELPCEMRRLYRSRQRSFRRLIVVDAPYSTQYEAWNVGIAISSYEYVLPLKGNVALYPKAIEHIAIALCTAPQHIDALRSTSSPAMLFSRNAIIAHGGFASDVACRIDSSSIIPTRIPILYHRRHTEKIFSPSMAIITLIVTLLIVKSATECLPFAISIILTIIMLWIAARWVAHSAKSGNCSMRDIFYHFKEIVNIFPLRKFMVW